MKRKAYNELVQDIADKRTAIKTLTNDLQFSYDVIKLAMTALDRGKVNVAYELLDQVINPT